MTYRRFTIAALVLLLVAAPSLARAENNPQSMDPKILGHTYGEWSAEWWTWALAGPDGANAVQDETGAYCAVHQPDGKVWFLAGTFGGTGIERDCTIPANKALFFPLVTALWTDCPPPSTDELLSDEEVRAILAEFGAGGNTACRLTGTVDGEPLLGGFVTGGSFAAREIPIVRAQSPRFSIPLPDFHLSDPGCAEPLLPGETDRRSLADGVWVMVPPLSPGEHVLEFHGAACDPSSGAPFFETGVTYHLYVETED